MNTYIKLLILFISLPVRSEVQLKVGDTYTLTPYPSINSVYLKIEALSEHQVLETIYSISYHGICIQHKSAYGNTRRPLHPTIISKAALLKSISIKRKPSINQNLECVGSKDYEPYNMDKQKFNEMLALNNDIEITPLDSRLSAYDETGSFKLVTN